MSPVNYSLRDGVALLGMDDGKANALGYEMMDALDAALDRADKEATAVVLAGRAGRFSAGFDLKMMMASVDSARALVTRGASALLRLYTLPQPLVIACTGHALAAGALLLLTGDVRIATRGPFRIGLNEVQIGMPLPVLGMELARDRLAPSHLAAATLFAQISDPESAVAAGWVDEVKDPDVLMDRAFARAKELGALPRDAYAKTKIALRERTVKYVRETLTEDMARLVPPVAQ